MAAGLQSGAPSPTLDMLSRLVLPLQSSPLARSAFAITLTVVFVLAMIPLSAVPVVVSFQDKLEHAIAFAVLMFMGWTGWPARTRRVAAGLLAYGLLIEFCQHTLTLNRVGDPLDVLADTVGIFVGWQFIRTWRPRSD